MKFSTILFIVIIMALTIICVRFLESYLNKKRYSNTNNIEEYIKNIQENNISNNYRIINTNYFSCSFNRINYSVS